MQPFEQLKFGNYYHIYNHGAGDRDLFREHDNYEFFLGLYDKYISPVAETYAWVLMLNHFHLLVKIKEEAEVIKLFTPDRVPNPVRGNIPSLQFSKLFNSYAQAFNKYYETRGSLFERPFKRKLIDSNDYLIQAILYIHNNPVHHGFCSHPLEYAWSSYHTCTSKKNTKLKRDEVLGWFGNQTDFTAQHEKKISREEIES
jgi:putative transposase